MLGQGSALPIWVAKYPSLVGEHTPEGNIFSPRGIAGIVPKWPEYAHDLPT